MAGEDDRPGGSADLDALRCDLPKVPTGEHVELIRPVRHGAAVHVDRECVATGSGVGPFLQRRHEKQLLVRQGPDSHHVFVGGEVRRVESRSDVGGVGRIARDASAVRGRAWGLRRAP